LKDFNFDWWKELAEHDPAAFYLARDRALKNMVEATPEHEQTLQALQDKVDQVRALSVSPLASAQNLAALLQEHLATLREGCEKLAAELQTLEAMQRAAPREPKH
jgi:hypothetical protein